MGEMGGASGKKSGGADNVARGDSEDAQSIPASVLKGRLSAARQLQRSMNAMASRDGGNDAGRSDDDTGTPVFRATNDKITGGTNESAQRRDEAKTDSHRQVGDPNRAVRQGRKFRDSDTGNFVYVDGDRVVICTPDGRQITQFKNTRANTQQRIQSGKWVPVNE